jgi:hypothetical protein
MVSQPVFPGGPRPDFYYCQPVEDLCRIAAGFCQRSHSRVRVPQGPMTIFYCLIRDSTNLKGHVPVFITPRYRVTQLYPQQLVSFFVASYDSQGYGGVI